MQFKSLDATLQTTNRETGQKQAITYRCADIDKMVPSLMGVSKVRGGVCMCVCGGGGWRGGEMREVIG